MNIFPGIEMISYSEAVEIIENEFKDFLPGTENVSLEDSLGRILAEDVKSDIDEPPFTNSGMDGIAVKYDPEITSWNIIGQISAGDAAEYIIDNHSCTGIMTGAKLPDSADTVIPVEDIEISGDRALLKKGVKPEKGSNVRYKGENLPAGSIALKKFSKITSRNIAALAFCGMTNVPVFRKLKIGIMSSGNELVPADEKPGVGKIRATNIHALSAAVKSSGNIAVPFGIVNDDRDNTEAGIKELLSSDVDIAITSGGVSVGKFDIIKDVLEKNGMATKFWRTYIKPGKPLLFGVYQKDGRKKLIFGLPGNPVSSWVTFYVFVRSAINKMLKQEPYETVSAVLMDNLRKNEKKRHFQRGLLKYNHEKKIYEVFKTGSSSSGNLMGLSEANCLIVIKEEIQNPQTGEVVECIRI